jgi:hypothetical protein
MNFSWRSLFESISAYLLAVQFHFNVSCFIPCEFYQFYKKKKTKKTVSSFAPFIWLEKETYWHHSEEETFEIPQYKREKQNTYTWTTVKNLKKFAKAPRSKCMVIDRRQWTRQIWPYIIEERQLYFSARCFL